MIRVVVADDEALVRAGIKMVLQPASDIEVVAEAANGREAVAAATAHRPDVVLMDVRMPAMDGLAALRELKRRTSPSKVVMLTTFDIDDYVHSALVEGAAGFLLKDTPPRQLTDAVRRVAAGDAMLSPEVTQRLVEAYIRRTPRTALAARHRLAVLTDRERAVAFEVAEGKSNAQIGRALGMTETTVKAHVSRTLTKLGLENRVQIALLVRDTDL
ncbi:response regulator [Glycomyces albidus]|uniref:Response regulator n=1 Tax=Glycomyces albidus TaxID=2656774 RepID=A0A6L5GEB6_9ACTN|nr:response regulator transcription factor [Glycomyces albidus]MQM27926.1 response regulator [Glycomyces albidus]